MGAAYSISFLGLHITCNDLSLWNIGGPHISVGSSEENKQWRMMVRSQIRLELVVHQRMMVKRPYCTFSLDS